MPAHLVLATILGSIGRDLDVGLGGLCGRFLLDRFLVLVDAIVFGDFVVRFVDTAVIEAIFLIFQFIVTRVILTLDSRRRGGSCREVPCFLSRLGQRPEWL